MGLAYHSSLLSKVDAVKEAVSCHEEQRYDSSAETVYGNIAPPTTLSLVVTTADSKR